MVRQWPQHILKASFVRVEVRRLRDKAQRMLVRKELLLSSPIMVERFLSDSGTGKTAVKEMEKFNRIFK